MSELDIVYDVLYTRMERGYALHLVDFPEIRIDAMDLGLAAHFIAGRLGKAPRDVAVRLREVDSIPGRDAPLRVEAPSTMEALRRLDEQLEDRDE